MTALTVTTGVLGLSLLMPLATAQAATTAITNGDFEADAVGATTVTGWTLTNGLIDLGVTQLGGCTSVDTSDYTTLRDYADEAEPTYNSTIAVGPDNELYAVGTTDQVYVDAAGAITTSSAPGAIGLHYGTAAGISRPEIYVVQGSTAYTYDDYADMTNNYAFAAGIDADVRPTYMSIPDPSVRADDVPPATDSDYWSDPPEFDTQVVDAATAYDPDFAPTSRALEIRSDMDADYAEGYVAHGGAAVSDPFVSNGNRTISLDWAASGASDDYHVLGYVLNTDTCQQVEVLDSTGEESDWQTTSVTLPNPGTYRFVFVSGTYDATWGGAAGAVMYIDNIRSQPTVTGTGLDLEPLFGVGDPVAGAPVQLTGGGLQPNSAWTAELHSTPVTLATGTTDASGNFWLIANLPLTVDPGRHQIILTGTAPDGSTRTDTAWITVTASGTVGYLSLVGEEGTTTPAPAPNGTVITATTATTAPAVLATTGAEPTTALVVAGGLLVAGAAGMALGRRNRTAR